MPDEDQRNRRLKRAGIAGAAIAIVIAVAGIAVRASNDRALADVAAAAATPTVTVVRPGHQAEGDGLTLPANVQAYNSAAIYARTSGYVRAWQADIGDHVRAGQVLAVIDAPEVDQQLAQARADYQTALANQALARSTSTRWAALLARDAVSRQEADEKSGDLAAKTALANAARANVARLGALQGFTRVRAPFDGVVTSRSTQIGALIVAGNAASIPLFTISDVRRMRVFVRVPQSASAGLAKGLHATLALPEYPARAFDAVLARSAGAVDPQSGTVLVELDADNRDGALKPGAYAQVRFPLASTGALTIPSSALVANGAGTSVAIVGANGRVAFRPVTVTRDDGAAVEIGAGLTGTERVIDTPPDSLRSGDAVHIQPAGRG